MPTAIDLKFDANSDGAGRDADHSSSGEVKTDRGIELARPLPFGSGVAPGTRFQILYPGERFDPFLKLALIEPDGPNFIVVEPGRLFSDYLIAIPEADAEILELEDPTDVISFVIVTTTRTPATVNLCAPILVNRKTKRGLQAILDDSGYSYAVPINAGTARP